MTFGLNKARPDPVKSITADDGRFLEIWNLVFMQFNRLADQTLVRLEKPSIDTGCGLERICSVLQGEKTNYRTDLFWQLLSAISNLAGEDYGQNKEQDRAMRVLADHIRAACLLLLMAYCPLTRGAAMC